MERTIPRMISTTALVSDIPPERERASCFIDPACFERFKVGVGSLQALLLGQRVSMLRALRFDLYPALDRRQGNREPYPIDL